MNAVHIFREHKKAVVEKWVEAVFSGYSLDTKGFLRTKQDVFCNPVGEITTTVAGYLYDAVAGEHVIPEKLHDALTRFVKLRSVQDFTPSQALGVICMLKQGMRPALLPLFVKHKAWDVYLEAESRLDTLVLMALDMYVASREALAEQRIKEIRDQHSQVVRWAQRHPQAT